MDYGYKITTHGRRLLAALLDTGQPLKLTRVAVGSGLIDQDEDLAKVHTLVHYTADATITDRRHEEDRLFLTVRYSNQEHPEVGTFTLSEFMVWAEDPETGQETDFLYATLGDYRQPVPAYSANFPASVWSFPLVLVVSGELEVIVTASPGLVTSEDLQEVIDQLKLEIMTNELTLPLAAANGEEMITNTGTPVEAVYRPNQSANILAAIEAMDGRLTAQIGQAAASCTAQTSSAKQSAIAAAQVYTDGRIAALQRQIETDSESVAGQIAQAKAEAVSTAETKIAAHNTAPAAHPTHLAVVSN